MTHYRNRRLKPAEEAPAMTVADYYRRKLMQPNPTPASYEEYRIHANLRSA